MATKPSSLSRRVARQIDATEAQINRFIADLDVFLSRSLSSILDDIRNNPDDAAQAAAQLGGLESTLTQLGLGDKIKGIRDVYGKELGFIRDEFQELSKDIIFTESDAAAIETLIGFDVAQVTTHVGDHVNRLRSQVMRGVLTGQVAEPRQLIEKSGGILANQLATELNTALQGFNRAVTQKKAKELGFTKFIYLGPLDKVTRPFCEPKVGRVFTQQEIDSWDNGQGLPANLYLGGYNCRHQLRPVE